MIFSQSSDIIERQSSMASSTEEMSAGNNDLSGGSRRDDAATDFGVFKDFDFLEYESESIEVIYFALLLLWMFKNCFVRVKVRITLTGVSVDAH